MKLLISDDGAEWNRDAARAFQTAGFELIYVKKDGFMVLEKIEQEHPDLVLIDLFMPSLDAIGVIHSAKRMLEDHSPLFFVKSAFSSLTLERRLCKAVLLFHHLSLQCGGAGAADDSILCTQSAPGRRASTNSGNPDNRNPSSNWRTSPYQRISLSRDSIMMAIETPDIINAVTKQLYPSVAKRYETTSSRVERAIRHAIEVAWDRGDVDILNSYFGYTIHNTRGKPTNSEFIAMISDKLRLHMKTAS